MTASNTAAPQTLALQRLYHWERQAPDRVAFSQPLGGGRVRDFRWGEAIGEARRMAAHLKGLGLPPRSQIAILSKNSVWWMLADYAVWMAGHVSVPLYPTLAPETIRQILEHSEAKLLFVGKLDGWEHMRPGVPAGLPCIATPLAPPTDYPKWEEIVARTEPIPGEPVHAADELATIMYTSGTTGNPKGVMHTFGAFALAVESGLKRIPLREDGRMLSYLPLAHVVERALVEHGQLATGMRVFFAESLESFTADLRRARPTVFFSVPRLWVKFQQGVLAKMPSHKLDRLLRLPLVRAVIKGKILGTLGLDRCLFAAGGAAPMPPELLQWYARLGLNIAEGYGMTENLGASHLSTGDPAQFGSVGTPYEGVDSRLDADSGEIQVRSAWTMPGYFKEPELTRRAFSADGWLCTGDKGALDAAGNLRITGRVKDLFKTSKGKYVAPSPIEDRLVMHASIEACVVAGANLAQPLGIVMLNAEAAQQVVDAQQRAALEASLQEHLRAVNAPLDPHERLECLVVETTPWTVDNGFITPTFKVKRNRVEEAYAARFQTWVSMHRPVVWTQP
jgi:long-chain acyl-CoA synthetase